MHKIVKNTIKVLGVGMPAALFLGCTLLIWQTRESAVVGVYHTAHEWGESTLSLNQDHSFTQEVTFMEYDQPEVSPYRRHVVMQRSIHGCWDFRGRDYFDQKIELSSFISLSPFDHPGKQFDKYQIAYGPVGLVLGIEIDEGADIVYWK